MKRFLPLFVFVFFFVTLSLAQAPKGINYQGVARDNGGKAYASKTIAVRISVLKNSATGEVEYAETHKPETNQFGLFTLVIGQGTKVTGDFALISWAIGSKWLQIEMDPNGGGSYTLAGTQQLMTVPYALYAEYAGNSSGLSAGSGISINNGVVSNAGDGDNDLNNELQNLSEVLIKSNNAGGIKITNLGAPVIGTDAATKNYVDAQNALQTLAEILTRANDAAAKQIKNLGAPTDANDAVTKNYVDIKFASDLDIDPTNELQDISQVLTKGSDAGGQKITNLGAPTSTNDAATKSYVDTQNALDLDQSATNEIQDLALNTTSNILNVTNNAGATPINLSPYKQTLTYTPATNNLAISGSNNVTISNTLTQVLTTNPNAGGIRVQNVGTPTTNTDATTKLYVDNAIRNYVDAQNALQTLSEILTRTNDAAAKQIKNLGSPTDANDAATKNYVDIKFASDLDIDPTNELQDISQVLTKGSDAGGQKITNLGAPTSTNDAATKSYVDTQNALDLDQSATNEIQDLALNTTSNILNVTDNAGATPINLSPYKQTLTYTPATNDLAISGGNNVTISNTLTQVLTTNPNAGGIRVQNVGTPTANTDATTKLYVDNAIATNYAFKINFSFTNATAGLQIDQEMVFTAEEFDSFNVVGANSFTATENGIYVFTLEGTYVKAGIINSGLISLFYNSTKYTIPMFIPFGSNTPRFNATFMFKLTAGQSIKILGEIVESGATFSGNFFGYKL